MTPLAALLCLAWTALVYWFIYLRPWTWALTLSLIPLALIAIALGAPGVWVTAANGYVGDSFWTLGAGGRFGVLTISGVGLALIFTLLAAKTRVIVRQYHIPGPILLLVDLALGVLLFGIVYAVSPQVFYSFYRLIFADLPNQWVIDTIFDTDQLRKIARLPEGGSLSDHLAGLSLWAILPFTLWQHLQKKH